MHTPGRQCRPDLAPEHRRQLETDYTVEHAARLLGVDQIQVYLTRMLYGVKYRVLGDLVEHYAPCFVGLQSQHLIQMPRNGFSLAVLIRCEPYHRRLRGSLAQVAHKLTLVVGYHVFGLKSVGGVDTQIVGGEVAYMTVA